MQGFAVWHSATLPIGRPSRLDRRVERRGRADGLAGFRTDGLADKHATVLQQSYSAQQVYHCPLLSAHCHASLASLASPQGTSRNLPRLAKQQHYYKLNIGT